MFKSLDRDKGDEIIPEKLKIEKNGKRTLITSISKDSLVQIYSFLFPQNISSCNLVCKQWHDAFLVDHLWQSLLFSIYKMPLDISKKTIDTQKNMSYQTYFKKLHSSYQFFYNLECETSSITPYYHTTLNNWSEESTAADDRIVYRKNDVVTFHNTTFVLHPYRRLYYFWKNEDDDDIEDLGKKETPLFYSFRKTPSLEGEHKKKLASIGIHKEFELLQGKPFDGETSVDKFKKLSDEDMKNLLSIHIRFNDGCKVLESKFALLSDLCLAKVDLEDFSRFGTVTHPTKQIYPKLPKTLKYLHSNLFGDGANEVVSGLKQLKYFQCDDVNTRTSINGSLFSNKPEMMYFKVRWIVIENPELMSMPNLRQLVIDYSKIGSLEFCRNMNHLVYINISNTIIEDLTPLMLLPKLEKIFATKSNVSNLGTYDKKGFPALKKLNLLESRVTKNVVDKFRNVYKHVTVFFEWKSMIISEIRKCKRLIINTVMPKKDTPPLFDSKNDVTKIDEFLKIFDIGQPAGHCMCIGEWAFQFYKESGTTSVESARNESYVYLTLHHNSHFRWSKWPSDVYLTRKCRDGLLKWMHEMGVEGPLKSFKMESERRKKDKKARNKSMAGLPDSIKEVFYDKRKLVPALKEEYKNIQIELTKLLTIYGSKQYEWSGKTYSTYKIADMIGKNYELKDVVNMIETGLKMEAKDVDAEEFKNCCLKYMVNEIGADVKSELYKIPFKDRIKMVFEMIMKYKQPEGLDAKEKITGIIRIHYNDLELNFVRKYLEILLKDKYTRLKKKAIETLVWLPEKSFADYIPVLLDIVKGIIKPGIGYSFEKASEKELTALILARKNVTSVIPFLIKLHEEEVQAMEKSIMKLKPWKLKKKYNIKDGEYRYEENKKDYRNFNSGFYSIALCMLGKPEYLGFEHFNSRLFAEGLRNKYKKMVCKRHEVHYKIILVSIKFVTRMKGKYGLKYICYIERNYMSRDDVEKDMVDFCEMLKAEKCSGVDMLDEFTKSCTSYHDVKLKLLGEWYEKHGEDYLKRFK